MELKFTKDSDRSVTLTEAEAVAYINDSFAQGLVLWGKWDNGYSYCGGDVIGGVGHGLNSGEAVVEYLRKTVAEKYGDNPTNEQLRDWSGYSYSGIRCDGDGRFIISISTDGKRWSEVSDS